ncbi:MAG: hypothetical protein WCJ17_02810, partial [bacterium]
MKQRYRYLQCMGALVIILGFSSIYSAEAVAELSFRLFNRHVDTTAAHYQDVQQSYRDEIEVLIRSLEAASSPEERAAIQQRIDQIDAKIERSHEAQIKEEAPQAAWAKGLLD